MCEPGRLRTEKRMEKVYLLWHTHPTGANENYEKLIGA